MLVPGLPHQSSQALVPNYFRRTEAEGAKLQTRSKRMKRCSEGFGGRFESQRELRGADCLSGTEEASTHGASGGECPRTDGVETQGC